MILQNNFKGSHHLGIKTDNAEMLAKWYQEKLGFTFKEKHILNGDLLLLFVEKGNVVLEFIQKGDGSAFKDLTHGKWDHFAMKCSKLKQHLTQLKEQGIEVADSNGDDPVILENFLEKGDAYFTIYSPNGEKVEFNSIIAVNEDADPQGRDWAHLGLPVVDLEKSLSFYNNLGFSECGSGFVDTPDGRVEANFLELDGFVIELYLLVGEELEEIKQRKGGLIDHICLETKDIDNAVKGLIDAGMADVSLKVDTMNLSGTDYRNCFINGPCGEKIELWQS